MNKAKAAWSSKQQFHGIAGSGHEIIVDRDKTAGNSPMELILIGLCGFTGYDVTTNPAPAIEGSGALL